MEGPWAFVETTLPHVPLLPISQRQPIRTERLLIRPMREDDLQAYHAMRLQPETMACSRQGRPDHDIEETRSTLNKFLPPHSDETFLYGVFLPSTGELIGEGGIHTLESSSCGWPEIGYRFRKEVWGQGYATEFLRALLKAWWDLPRRHTKLRVHSTSIQKGSSVDAIEQIHANTDMPNIGSQKVLAKIGFIQFSKYTEPDTQEHRIGEPLELLAYRLPFPGDDSVN
ncbi:acyl-CoA N-acyltransferase [Daldinia vernicosa]|uniref:acyl-CoA N-acyltransferase n=1 Tax=Daldinia vernicosa TaxID=114800 RepID=UPI002008ACC8|nr:acyl-CoA N-acyltransferase [Daldinia vernicosa]KAI0845007.1 acyl-CoA N-acyltransferase [Daldinia vernicosa]